MQRRLWTVAIIGWLALALVVFAGRARAVFLPATAQQVAAVSGAATVGGDAGIVTSESLSTAHGASYTLTVGVPAATAASLVMASVRNGTNSGGAPVLLTTAPGSGVVTFVVNNSDAANAFNGTVVVSFIVFN